MYAWMSRGNIKLLTINRMFKKNQSSRTSQSFEFMRIRLIGCIFDVFLKNLNCIYFLTSYAYDLTKNYKPRLRIQWEKFSDNIKMAIISKIIGQIGLYKSCIIVDRSKRTGWIHWRRTVHHLIPIPPFYRHVRSGVPKASDFITTSWQKMACIMLRGR